MEPLHARADVPPYKDPAASSWSLWIGVLSSLVCLLLGRFFRLDRLGIRPYIDSLVDSSLAFVSEFLVWFFLGPVSGVLLLFNLVGKETVHFFTYGMVDDFKPPFALVWTSVVLCWSVGWVVVVIVALFKAAADFFRIVSVSLGNELSEAWRQRRDNLRKHGWTWPAVRLQIHLSLERRRKGRFNDPATHKLRDHRWEKLHDGNKE